MLKKAGLLFSALVLAAMFFNSCARHEYEYDQNNALKENIYVLLIGIDGWGSYSLEKADIPNIKAFMREGAYQERALNIMPAITLPNWTTMWTGSTTDRHGVQNNNEPPAPLPSVKDKFGVYPNIFGLLRASDKNAETGYIYEKAKMRFLVPDKVPSFKKEIRGISYDLSSLNPVTEYIKTKKPRFAAIVFGGPDQIGHSDGHDTPAYYETLRQIDEAVGIIKQACIDAGIYENTVFVFSADHGGHGKTHGDDIPSDREIPVVFSGKGIKNNYAIQRQVNIYDIVPTIAVILGLNPPEEWNGTALTEILSEAV